MNRTALLNHLIAQRNAASYLELGVNNENLNFIHIQCAHKTGVDTRPVSTFQGTTDAFFEQNTQSFDVIFIDAMHTEEQVLKDFANASRCVSPNGVIVLHDCLPPDAWHQRAPELFTEGETWNGTVWKAALRIFNQTTHRCTLVDTDWGCGIIDFAAAQQPACIQLPQQLYYEQHFRLLSRYCSTVADYLRNQVKLFYHLACMHEWQPVFEEQMQQLQQQGFTAIELSVLGSEQDLQQVRDTCRKLGIQYNLNFHSPELTYFETPAMLAIESHARRYNGYVLYLHSKGVSNPHHWPKARWRRLMMEQLVQNWQQCAIQLPYYDAIGVNWRDMPPVSHFSGNFWYAATGYIRSLADFREYYESPRYHIGDSINARRLGCEFWIGSGGRRPNVLSLVCRNVDFCQDAYWHSNAMA
ncbi:class I SAM-dependent methyltransferase [Deminuibacter soli]|uniref:Class I SAM-dependent methyltransferase n=1 Tax=Deminuibacter soli TaxID=2291815 RepID=A0A3E1NGN1_9BACT|nr:class I SAM-dependent methyltransferase [Deminuibacter soli]RFM26948.1 class I SAM-dependent methyltransferase [Deminuibacter soli]